MPRISQPRVAVVRDEADRVVGAGRRRVVVHRQQHARRGLHHEDDSSDEPSVCSQDVSLGTFRKRNCSIRPTKPGALLDPLEGGVDDELADGRSCAWHLDWLSYSRGGR